MKSNAVESFRQSLPRATHFYAWPRIKRPRNEQGQSGSLHAKCAVADAQIALVSSANFTAHALSLNMEMGVLIRGGSLPSQVAAHLHHLIASEEWIEIGAD